MMTNAHQTVNGRLARDNDEGTVEKRRRPRIVLIPQTLEIVNKYSCTVNYP